ncbi:EamA family transporter, partial [Acinetobacter baumannii]
GVFATALPIALYMNILRLAGPTRGSMNGYLVPVWTILLGMAVLGETVGLREGLGAVFVRSGIALASIRSAPAAVSRRLKAA